MTPNVAISLPARLSADDIPSLAAKWEKADDRQSFLMSYLASVSAADTAQDRAALEVNAAIIDQSGLWEHVEPDELASALGVISNPKTTLTFLLAGAASQALAREVQDLPTVRHTISRMYDRMPETAPATPLETEANTKGALRGDSVHMRMEAVDPLRLKRAYELAKRMHSKTAPRYDRETMTAARVLAKELGARSVKAVGSLADILHRLKTLENRAASTSAADQPRGVVMRSEGPTVKVMTGDGWVDLPLQAGRTEDFEFFVENPEAPVVPGILKREL